MKKINLKNILKKTFKNKSTTNAKIKKKVAVKKQKKNTKKIKQIKKIKTVKISNNKDKLKKKAD